MQHEICNLPGAKFSQIVEIQPDQTSSIPVVVIIIIYYMIFLCYTGCWSSCSTD